MKEKDNYQILQDGYMEAIKFSYNEYTFNNPSFSDNYITKNIKTIIIGKEGDIEPVVNILLQSIDILLKEKVIHNFFKSLDRNKIREIVLEILKIYKTDFVLFLNYLKKADTDNKMLNLLVIQRIFNYFIFWNIFAKKVYLNIYMKNLSIFLIVVLILGFWITYFILKYLLKYVG